MAREAVVIVAEVAAIAAAAAVMTVVVVAVPTGVEGEVSPRRAATVVAVTPVDPQDPCPSMLVHLDPAALVVVVAGCREAYRPVSNLAYTCKSNIQGSRYGKKLTSIQQGI